MSSILDNCLYSVPMGTTDMPFGEWLRRILDEKGMSVSDLAHAIGVKPSTVSRWRKGTRIVDPEFCEPIAIALGISPDVVLRVRGIRRMNESPSRYDVLQGVRSLKDQLSELEVKVREPGIQISILGRVPADRLRWTAGYEGQYIEVAQADIEGAHEPFAVELTGECMRSIGMYSGDIVILERPEGRAPKHRQLVLLRVNGEMTFKRWSVTANGVELLDGDNHNEIAQRDLHRYYAVLSHSLPVLSRSEALLITDALNGTLLEPHTLRLLWAEVDDAIRLDQLDQKWAVDGARLVRMLRDDLSYAACVALIDAIERAWRGVSDRDIEVSLRESGLIS